MQLGFAAGASLLFAWGSANPTTRNTPRAAATKRRLYPALVRPAVQDPLLEKRCGRAPSHTPTCTELLQAASAHTSHRGSLARFLALASDRVSRSAGQD